MAAGRHGGYRDHERRVRESDVEASRKKDFATLDRYRDGDRAGGRNHRGEHGPKDRAGEWPRDVKKRDSSNGRRRSPPSNLSSGGGSGDERARRSVRERLTADREPGELSSGSGSDETGAPSAWKMSNGKRIQRADGTMAPSPSKKRKFSPIVWDMDDGKKPTDATALRSEKDLPQLIVPPPPPPLQAGHAPHELGEMVLGPVNQASLLDVKVSIDSSHEFGEMVRAPSQQSSLLDVKVSIDSPLDELNNKQELQQMDEDEEEYPTARNISSSRWADGNSAVDHEADAHSEEPMINRKKNVMRILSSPELGEVITKEGSEGISSNSSDSGREHNDDQAVEVDENAYMEIDGEEDAGFGYDHLSDTDSGPDDTSDGIPGPEQPPQRCINMLQGCRSVDDFERLNKINEGTYGVVYRAKDKKTGAVVALKKVKMEKELEGFPLTSLREINILLSFHHSSIVDVKEVVVGSSLDSIFMVMEYMEHDLKALMETMKQPFSQSEVKCLMLQLLDGVEYLHDNWVLHRDLKTSNILMNNCGELKICDFGLSRQYGSPLRPYTQLVVTLWYRAPELLLGAKEYSTAIDMWSLGCILAELLAKEPLFSGKNEIDQLDMIFKTLGTPNEKIWPGISKLPGYKTKFVNHPYNRLREKFPPTSFSGRPTLSEAGFDLLNKLLTYDPEKRITAEAALKHPWFQEVPLPKSKDFMPTFPAQNAQDRRLRRVMKSPDPFEELRIKDLQQGKLGSGSIFG